MVVKFFKPPSNGGSVGAVKYLLNSKRVKNGTARVLQGDVETTTELINSIKNKHKVDVGCLSFEEKNIDEALKFQLMREFEEMILPEMQGKYNILWVEHVDKGRLELNFVIPKVELERGRAITPYYHASDLPRVETWQDLTNLYHNFSDPKDPEKARTVELNSKVVKLTKDFETLDKQLHQGVALGLITNRDELLKTIKDSGITVQRVGKDYISVKLPQSKKARRFKGAIYNEQFTSLEYIGTELAQKTAEIEEYRARNRNIYHRVEEISRLREKLEKLTDKKRSELEKRYKFSREKEQENQAISVPNRELPNNSVPNVHDTDFSRINDADTRGRKQSDILRGNSKKAQEIEPKKVKVAFIQTIKYRKYIPFWEYERAIKESLGERYNVERNRTGHIVYQDVKTDDKIVDKGENIHFQGDLEQEPNIEQLRTMIEIAEHKGWELEDLTLHNCEEETELLFNQVVQNRILEKELEAIKTTEKEEVIIEKPKGFNFSDLEGFVSDRKATNEELQEKLGRLKELREEIQEAKEDIYTIAMPMENEKIKTYENDNERSI